MLKVDIYCNTAISTLSGNFSRKQKDYKPTCITENFHMLIYYTKVNFILLPWKVAAQN